MPQANLMEVIALFLVLGTSPPAVRDGQEVAPAPMQNRSQIDQDYQNRLRLAKFPQARARIQAEYDRMKQQALALNDGSDARFGAGGADIVGDTGGGSAPRGQDAFSRSR